MSKFQSSKKSRQLRFKPAGLDNTSRRVARTLRACRNTCPASAVYLKFLLTTSLPAVPELAEAQTYNQLQCGHIPWLSCNQLTYFDQGEKYVESRESLRGSNPCSAPSGPQNGLRTNAAVDNQYCHTPGLLSELDHHISCIFQKILAARKIGIGKKP